MLQKLSIPAVALALLSCQTYDFEPVQPLAVSQVTQSTNVAGRKLKPNLMLLVDKSGSMDAPINPSDSRCTPGCGPGGTSTCPPGCPTRMTELKTAMSTFLSRSGSVARMGLVFYPADNFCGPANAIAEALPPAATTDDDAAYQAKANAVNARIASVSAGGGTPTGASLAFAGTNPGLTDFNDNRQDFVLLLTDGLPNCNANNPNGGCPTPPAACKCTTASCGTANNLCTLGCLDRSGVVDNVQQLRAKKILVIVVGFGADTAVGDGPDVLNAMAEAGGFARQCPNGTDAECGTGNTCNTSTNVCVKKFYQATNAIELADALAKISDIIGLNPCEFILEAQPSDPRFLAVIIDGTNTPSGPDTWAFSQGKVMFQGALCDRVRNATTAQPMKVEIRIVESL